MVDKSQNTKTMNHRYELAGQSVLRQLGMWVRMKTSVLGNFDTGPGLKNLLTLAFLHWLGRPLFWMRTWLQNQHALKAKIRAMIPGKKS